ncbi:kinase-like domain-containing protein [Thelephora terrestris]|uniref:Kinase-like domain-containing protein n=1 Tax=Thelephora terrestris TaxID=56493 RepID=A0A9P6H3T9_9AGAM|nr:kinase-like domain-containing protein [Thelephora terrestris]
MYPTDLLQRGCGIEIISSWMPGGDLVGYIKNSNADRLSLLSDVVEGLCYLHSYDVIHGRLKGSNVLVDDVGRARISDFGLSRVTNHLNYTWDTRSFAPQWSAPELLSDGTHSKKADIFSFAMVMVEVFTGAVPFYGQPAAAVVLDIMKGKRPERPRHPSFTVQLGVLMERCWKQDPSSRPEAVDVLFGLRSVQNDQPTWRRLISNTLAKHERISLIDKIFSDPNQAKTVSNLSRDDTQIFVDKINEASFPRSRWRPFDHGENLLVLSISGDRQPSAKN